jgi:hypothetical protein
VPPTLSIVNIQLLYKVICINTIYNLYFSCVFLRFTKRGKKQEFAVLSQGITFNVPSMTASRRLPQPLSQPDTLPRGRDDVPHQFHSPPDTSGTAKLKRRHAPVVPINIGSPPETETVPKSRRVNEPPVPIPTHQRPLTYILPHQQPALMAQQPALLAQQPALLAQQPALLAQQHQPATGVLPAPIPFGYLDKTTGFLCTYPGITVPKDTIPYTTQRYRDQMAKKVEAGGFKRKYKKKTNVVLCKRCGKDKEPTTHTQYFGNVYCRETATVSLE